MFKISTKHNFIKNSIIVGLMTSISRITGLIRDICLAHFVGSNRVADIFLIATRIPSTFRSIFADGAFNNSFIPILSKIDKKNNQIELKDFLQNVLSILFYILLIFTIITIIFMPFLVTLFAGGIKGETQIFNNLVMICRITFPFLLFISITRFFSGILETKNKFCLVAFSPIITNTISILGILFSGYYSLNVALWGAIAFSIGGVIQALTLFYANRKNGFGIVPHSISFFYQNIRTTLLDTNIKLFLKNIIPGIVSGGIYNINMMISTFFASSIAGAISWIYYAERFVQLPLGIIGIAVGTVLFPKISAAENNNEIVYYFNKACRAVLFLIIPLTVGIVIIGNLIIDLVYKSGAFNINDVKSVSSALSILSIALPFLSLNRYVSIVFYAKHDTKTPMKIAAICAALNIIFSCIFVKILGFLGITVTSVIITITNFTILYWIMYKNNFCKIDTPTIKFITKSVIASIAMAIFTKYMKLKALNYWFQLSIYGKIIELLKITTISAFLYFTIFILLHKIVKIKKY